MKHSHRNRPRRAKGRRGVECVEVAITLPLMLLVWAATVQICHRVHVTKMLYLATYEAVRVGGSTSGGLEAAKQVFADRTAALGITGATLQVSGGFDQARFGDRIAAQGVAPSAENSELAPMSFLLPTLITSGKVVYRKEGS